MKKEFDAGKQTITDTKEYNRQTQGQEIRQRSRKNFRDKRKK